MRECNKWKKIDLPGASADWKHGARGLGNTTPPVGKIVNYVEFYIASSTRTSLVSWANTALPYCFINSFKAKTADHNILNILKTDANFLPNLVGKINSLYY